MSELKSYKNIQPVFNTALQKDAVAADDYDGNEILFEESDEVYFKSEADKVIAGLKAQKAQAEDDCAYWKMSEGNAVNAMRETERACMFLTISERHHKYKRCLANAKVCAEKLYIYGNEFYCKWLKRWLAIAEKFKDKDGK
jgi:hypothetical protein